MKILIASDLHIKDTDFEELTSVCNEIYQLSTYHQVEELWLLGDSFDRIIPSIREVDFFSNFLKRFKNNFIRIIAAPSHESKSKDETVLTHFGILSDNIQIASEFKLTLGKNKIYLGHFMVQESLCGFKEEKNIKDFSEYDLVLLGHQHSHQKLGNNGYHLGSCRFINFNETADRYKYVAILNDNKGLQIDFVKLQTPYPMKVLDSKVIMAGKGKENGFLGVVEESLTALDPKTKVKVVLRSFQELADYLPFEETYKKKFYLYKRDNKFEIAEATELVAKEDLSMRQYLTEWLSKQKINEEIKKILEEIIK